MKNNPAMGFNYLIRGLKLLTEPGLRLFVIVPLVVNVILFAGLVAISIQQFSSWIDSIINWLPSWLSFIASFIEWLLWPLLIASLTIIIGYSFTILANLVAAPFNSLLSEKVEEKLTGQEVAGYETMGQALLGLPKGIAREGVKILYYLPRLLVIFILTLLMPPIAIFLWFVLGAWMMAIEYCDYPMDNHRHRFAELKTRLKAQRMTAMGFGGGVMLGTMIPIVNFIIMPAAVCGATIYWVENLKE